MLSAAPLVQDTGPTKIAAKIGGADALPAMRWPTCLKEQIAAAIRRRDFGNADCLAARDRISKLAELHTRVDRRILPLVGHRCSGALV